MQPRISVYYTALHTLLAHVSTREKRIKVLVISDVKRSFHPPHLGMRIGDDYQAVIPEFDPDNKPESNHDAMLVWAPKPALNEQKLDDYVTLAKEKYGYNAGKNS